jgi:hypothetical protein
MITRPDGIGSSLFAARGWLIARGFLFRLFAALFGRPQHPNDTPRQMLVDLAMAPVEKHPSSCFGTSRACRRAEPDGNPLPRSS